MHEYLEIQPLNPLLHPAYVNAIERRSAMPQETRAKLEELLARRNSAPDAEVDRINSEIVGLTWWYAIRPDEIARSVMRRWGWRSPVTVRQATTIVAALGEAGFPIMGNGAPEPYDDPCWMDHPPLSGFERSRLLLEAARHWAQMAARSAYVSFGDCRGFTPRPVQYDEPGTVHPSMRVALMLAPAADRGTPYDPVSYMRKHTRKLVLVLPQ